MLHLVSAAWMRRPLIKGFESPLICPSGSLDFAFRRPGQYYLAVCSCRATTCCFSLRISRSTQPGANCGGGSFVRPIFLRPCPLVGRLKTYAWGRGLSVFHPTTDA